MTTTPTLDLIPPPVFGHAALCRDCRHRFHDLSHPTPCQRLRWFGAERIKPTLDGERCSDFDPR